MHGFDKYWDTFTDVQRAEIEQDFKQADQVSDDLIVGPRYAYIRWTCRVIPYDRIGSIYFVRGKNMHCYMHIEVKGEKEVFVDLPSFRDGEAIREELIRHM